MAASVKIEFDDGSRVISQSLYENAGTGAGQGLSGETRPPSCKLEDFYEISKTTEFVSSGNFSRIALQFPDSLLEDAPEVLWVLESRLRKLRRMSTDACGDGAGGAIKERCEGGVPEPLMFVTGDTSYGSCCVDEVSAKHLKADAIVHYGRACLSPTSCSVPVLYVFGRGSVDVEHLAECLLSGPLRPLSPPSGTVGNASADGGESSVSAGTAVRDESTPTSPVLLLYDVTYAHAILALIHILGDDVVRNGRLVVGFPTPQAYSPSTGHRGRDGANLERDALGEVSPILNEAATAVSPVLPISGGSSTNPNAGSCCRGEGENGNSCSGAGVVGVGGESEPETAHQGKSDTPVDARNTPVLTATEDLTAILSAMTLGPSAPGVASRKRRTIRIGGLGVGLESEEALERCTLVFIGPEGRQLSNILLRCSSCRRRMRYDPSRPVADRLVADSRVGNRDLMRRYYLVQRAREAGIIGIVVGTLGVKHYGNVVRSLRRMVEDEGRKAYTLAVGKINVAKLANFAEVDVFCLVACAENSLLDSKEFHAPVVTPLELEVALGRREWDGFYSTDFDDIAELTEASREAQDRRKSPQAPPSSSSPDVSARGRIDSPEGDDDDGEDRPFFSLVTGTYKSVPGALSRKSGNPVVGTGESVGNNGISVGTSGEAGALATLSDRSLMEWVSPAAEFLNQRKFKGLEPLIGKTEAEAATEGQTGIASDYGGF